MFESQICITCSNRTFVSPWLTGRKTSIYLLTHICIPCFNHTFVLHAVMPHVLSTCVFASICLLIFQTHPARSLWHWTVSKATWWFMTPREWRLTVLPAMADPHPQWGWLAEPTGRRCTASCPPDVQCDGEVWGQRCVCLYSPQWHGDPGGQRHRQSHCAMWVCGNNIGLVVVVSPLFSFHCGGVGGGGCVVWLSAWTPERGC